MRWGWISAGRQAASAGGAGVVSARLPERLVRRYRSRADWTGLDGIGRDWTGLDGIGAQTHWPLVALGGVVTHHPHRSVPQHCTPMARRQARASEIFGFAGRPRRALRRRIDSANGSVRIESVRMTAAGVAKVRETGRTAVANVDAVVRLVRVGAVRSIASRALEKIESASRLPQ